MLTKTSHAVHNCQAKSLKLTSRKFFDSDFSRMNILKYSQIPLLNYKYFSPHFLWHHQYLKILKMNDDEVNYKFDNRRSKKIKIVVISDVTRIQ